MIFCTIHLPPLPAVVSRLDREDNEVLDDDATESSHSIIGSMMEWAAMANNDKANATRLLAQTDSLRKFEHELAGLDLENCTAEALFEFYCRHTRQWLNTYSTVGNMLRFKPLDYIVNKDKTHQNMTGYTNAQFRLHTGQTPESGSLDGEYAEQMRWCAQWTKQSLAESKSREGADDVFNKRLQQVADPGDGGTWISNAENNGVDLVLGGSMEETELGILGSPALITS